MCGGTSVCGSVGVCRGGLSPRVRGNLQNRQRAVSIRGSIPACAGEPPYQCGATGIDGVYPRVCGGTHSSQATNIRSRGLSPRVRGNRRSGCQAVGHDGSIPACAGEPWCSASEAPSGRVYPRVCGGTRCLAATPGPGIGLSPRVRGNRCPLLPLPPLVRSIPACAGEPWLPAAGRTSGRVYPRVCGGTRSRCPTSSRRCVYPRVCGGTGGTMSNLLTRRGSIPACAGEPSTECHQSQGIRVYPRVCGGTDRFIVGIRTIKGLSPRVRGNPQAVSEIDYGCGSIPACAGEPP